MVRRRTATLLAALAVTAGLSACSPARTAHRDRLLDQHVPSTVAVTTRRVGSLGRVLVDGAGRTLYMFPPDAGSRVSCTGPCAGTWPPLVMSGRGRADAGSGVDRADLGALTDPNTGARIITYAGYPLYRYAGDLRPGEAYGQALFNNGGPWYVLTPAGQPVTVDPGEGR